MGSGLQGVLPKCFSVIALPAPLDTKSLIGVIAIPNPPQAERKKQSRSFLPSDCIRISPCESSFFNRCNRSLYRCNHFLKTKEIT